MGAVDDLVRFRQSLVEMRRTCAARADGVLTRGDRAELAGQMKTIQEWIDASIAPSKTRRSLMGGTRAGGTQTSLSIAADASKIISRPAIYIFSCSMPSSLAASASSF